MQSIDSPVEREYLAAIRLAEHEQSLAGWQLRQAARRLACEQAASSGAPGHLLHRLTSIPFLKGRIVASAGRLLTLPAHRGDRPTAPAARHAPSSRTPSLPHL
jgi:hypothetical protein